MGLDNPIHLMLLLVILLLVFGAKRLPEMGRSLGDGLRGFKDAIGSQPAVHHLDATAPAATDTTTDTTSSTERSSTL